MRTFDCRRTLAVLGSVIGATSAAAAPVTYTIDPNHTYPAFEADHMGGLSVWRGKINSSSGTIILDKEGGTGTVNITMDMTTIDFGHDALNEHAQRPDMFDTQRFPTATYTGRLTGFRDGAPSAVDGTLTLRGVSKPLRLTINSFLCKPHPQRNKEVCGADATATLNRDDYGLDIGKSLGFHMGVTLRISVEALAD